MERTQWFDLGHRGRRVAVVGARSRPALAARPTFTEFAALYIAEGSKTNRNRAQIANSDPAVMILAARWLSELTDRELTFSIQYHAEQDLSELARFWSDLLGFEPDALRLQRKSNSGMLAGRTWRSLHGVLTITIADTALRARLQAWIDLTKASWQ